MSQSLPSNSSVSAMSADRLSYAGRGTGPAGIWGCCWRDAQDLRRKARPTSSAPNTTSASAVTAGKKSVRMPTSTLTMPSKTKAPQRCPERPARTAATRFRMPSTRAYAPKTATRAATAAGGQNSAMMPNTIAAAPRKASAHQLRARLNAMDVPPRGRSGRARPRVVLVHRPGPARSLLRASGGALTLALDLDAPPLRLLRKRERDLQDAVVEARLRPVRIDPFRQRDHPGEAAVGPLRAIDTALLLGLHLRTALAFDHQRAVVRDLEADVVGGQPGKVGPDHELAVTLDHLDGGRPIHRQPAALERAARAGNRQAPAQTAAETKLLEHAIEVLHHAPHERERALRERPGERQGRAPLQRTRSTAGLLFPSSLGRLRSLACLRGRACGCLLCRCG